MSWTDEDPGQGSPDGLLALAADLQADADDAASAARMLRSVQNNASDAVWKGTSADAFRDRIDKLPGHLDKLNASYADAAAGIRSYAAIVRQIADDARVQQQIVSSSSGDLHTAQAQQAAWTPPPHPATGQPDPAAKNPHDDQVAAANASIKKAQARLHDLADQRKTADGKLVGALNHAHGEGMKNKHWWQKALDFVSEALAVITIVLMVIAVIAVVILAIVQPELIPGLLVVAGEALTALSAAKLATDGARKAGGEDVSWGELGIDALGGVPGLGELGAGVKGFELSAKLAETMPRAASMLSKTATVIRENSLVVKTAKALERLREPELPTAVFSRSRGPNIAQTFDESVARGGPTRLERVNAAARDANRRSALRGVKPAPKGQSLDEYPFASSKQGGAGPYSVVKAVPKAEQDYQGGVLSSFYQKYGVKPGDSYNVRFEP